MRIEATPFGALVELMGAHAIDCKTFAIYLDVVQRVRKDGALVAIVDNELLKSPWKVGHEIVVLPEHVLETSDPNDMTFASLLSVLGSSEAAMLWREMRLMDGSGATAKPKTFFVLPDIN